MPGAEHLDGWDTCEHGHVLISWNRATQWECPLCHYGGPDADGLREKVEELEEDLASAEEGAREARDQARAYRKQARAAMDALIPLGCARKCPKTCKRSALHETVRQLRHE